MIQSSASRDGSTYSALILAAGLRERNWRVSVVFREQGPMTHAFEAAGFEVTVQPYRNWLGARRLLRFLLTPLRDLPSFVALVSLFRRMRAEVVYVNTSASLCAVLAGRLSGARTVLHVRELFEDVGGEMRVPPRLRNVASWLLAVLPNAVITNTAFVARNMLGCRGERAEVIANAVDASFLDAPHVVAIAGVEAWSEDARVVGVPGNLRPVKGHAFFLSALAPILLRRPEVHVVVAGEGTKQYRQKLEMQIKEAGLVGRVTLIGDIEDMRRFYQSCDVVCIPSISETFGRVAIESFAMGVPVVATRVGGLAEVVRHEENGLVVEYGDEAGLAAAVTRLLDDQELVRCLTTTARQHVLDRYTPSVYVDRVESVIQRVLAVV